MSVGDIRLHTNVIREVWVREVQTFVKYGTAPPVSQEALAADSQRSVVQRRWTCCKRAEGSITYAGSLNSLPLFEPHAPRQC